MPLLNASDPAAVALAADALAAGELVAFPTETVYGLGARADDDAAVARIFAAKGRPADHPLIVHVADLDAAGAFAAAWGPLAQRLAAAFWPGPLTLIVPRRVGRGVAAAGGQGSIGLRMPAHPLALALLQQARRRGVAGVAGPSANRFGRVSPTTAAHVQQEFGSALLVLDGGACAVGIESTIVDCSGEADARAPALLRPGQLARERIEAVLGQRLALPDGASARASGTLASHYAPSVPVHLYDAAVTPGHQGGLARPGPGQVLGVYSRLAPAAGLGWAHRTMPADAAAAAHDLFAVLREFDAAGVSAIWVERPPPGSAWDGVRDRLMRASA